MQIRYSVTSATEYSLVRPHVPALTCRAKDRWMPGPKHYCETRNELADSLVDVAIRLSIAAVEMARTAGVSEDSAYLKAKAETERLRDEGESIKAELSHHRLKHGC